MSFGEEIRRERELRQISLREVAQATKINLRYLEAMERNEFGYLPGGLFNRAFVRAYCEHIGVDSESMVNAYLLEEQTQAGEAGDPDSGLLRGPSRVGSSAQAGRGPEPPVPPTRPANLGRWVVAVLATGAVVAGLYVILNLLTGEPG